MIPFLSDFSDLLNRTSLISEFEILMKYDFYLAIIVNKNEL